MDLGGIRAESSVKESLPSESPYVRLIEGRHAVAARQGDAQPVGDVWQSLSRMPKQFAGMPTLVGGKENRHVMGMQPW